VGREEQFLLWACDEQIARWMLDYEDEKGEKKGEDRMMVWAVKETD
jgi:hypothetical protein